MKTYQLLTILWLAALWPFGSMTYAITRSLTYNGSSLSTAVNTVATVARHDVSQTLTTPVDYVITAQEGTEAMTASIDIAHEQATVVFSNIRPSQVVSTWLRFITINGAPAVDGSNCRVETYRHGAILLPYPIACHPLTVFTGTASSGNSRSDFDVNTYYTDLGDFDNAIKSFTLKRGYMVTMANHADGTGYSHCFIANDGDITVTLPKDLQGSVSFLRIFRWRWPAKKGYAGRNETPMRLMRVSWFYQWNSENYQLADYDYVPQRHHENGSTYTGKATYAWPSWGNINAEASAHVLGVNEPDNTSGSEMYMTVPDLFKLHAEYLRSGMRVGTFATCNPNVSWVKAYIDSCEAHNYRVDFVATHYYIGGQTPQNCINSLKALYTATQLPVWCTEWNNGANWTSETRFYTDSLGSWYTWGNGDDQKMNGIWLRDVLKRADQSDNTEWLERLAVYNNVEQKRFVHWESDDFWTTSGGAIFGAYNSDFAYKKSTDVWMDWRDQGAPCQLIGGLSLDKTAINLSWREPNTDWIKTVYVQQNTSGSTWTTRATLGVDDSEAREASLSVAACSGKKVFRICSIDAKGQSHYSNTIDLSDSNLPAGCIKLTSIPASPGDYYYLITDKSTGKLCWTPTNAHPATDYTGRVSTLKDAWTGASGTTTGNGIPLVELYNSSSAGTKMSQKVSLPNGIYTAVLYATSHNARGEDGATLNGTRDNFAYVFATTARATKKTYFTASGVTPGFLSNEPIECTISGIEVTDNQLTLGLGIEQSNITGWHCIQIKSLSRTGDIEGAEASDEGIKAVAYNTVSAIGTDLSQVWQMEPHDNGGYSLRNPDFYNYILTSQSNALFQTDGITSLPTEKSRFTPVYDSGNDCWRMRNDYYSTYCGTKSSTLSAGDEVAGDCSLTDADRLSIYAIRKSDFNQQYVVEQGHHDVRYTIDNPDFSWGSTTGAVSGSGRVVYPNRWTFAKTFDGWNDAFTGTATMSDGTTGTFFNVWAGSMTYAELMQEVKHLPNGVYRLTADFATTDGYGRTMTKTALYGNAGTGNIARSYNITGKGDNTFCPYECYVLVTDHTLTIGARSDGTWFKVGAFNLSYVCPEEEATEEILGLLDNGRALQHQCWLMDSEWIDLSAYPHCRDLQIDQTPANALIKIAPTASLDVSYNNHNVIKGGMCDHFVITDEEPLTVKEDFTAREVTYRRNDVTGKWQELFLPFSATASSDVRLATIAKVRSDSVYVVQASVTTPNQPAVINTDNALLHWQDVEVKATKEYAGGTTRLNGIYSTGAPVSPLRWYREPDKPLSALHLLFIGDVNRDGSLTISDVTTTVNIILGEDNTPPYLFDHEAADVNLDNNITVADVTDMVNFIVGKLSVNP